MALELTLLTIALLLLLESWRGYRRQRSAIEAGRRPQRLSHYPSVSVIRPIRGLDTRVERNIRAALDHRYPGELETLFVFDDTSEPAIPLVREAIRARRRTGQRVDAQILFCGQPPTGQTGKLNAMIVGLGRARHELISFVDSDVLQDREAMATLVETLVTTPGAGAAFAPAVMEARPRTVGDVGYALLLNGLYGPAAALTTQKLHGELPFIMGQFMIFKRKTLEAIGGLQSAEGQLVDDMYIGMRVKAAGYHNVVSSHSVAIIAAGSTLGEFLQTFVRWITYSRSGLPGSEFKLQSWLRGALFWLGLVLAAAAAAAGVWVAAGLAALAALTVAISINVLHTRLGGWPVAPRYVWVSTALLLISPLVYLSVYVRRQVSWRGRTYTLGADSRLAQGHALEPDQTNDALEARRTL
jgi:ceramide glucosyltransferase